MQSKNKTQLHILKAIARPYRALIILMLLVILVASLLEGIGLSLLLPLLQVVIEGRTGSTVLNALNVFASHSKESSLLLNLSFIFLAAITVKFAITLYRIYLSKRFIWGIRLFWMNRIFEKYLHARYEFILNHKQGELLNHLLLETQRGALCLSQMIEFAARFILTVILTATLLVIQFKASVVILVLIVGILMISHGWTRRFSHRIGIQRIKLSQELSAWSAEAISAIRQIKTFGLEAYFIKSCYRINKTLSSIQIRFDILREAFQPFSEVLLAVLLMGGVVYATFFSTFSLKGLVPVIGVFAIVGQRLMSSITTLAELRVQIISFLPSMNLSYQLAQEVVEEERVVEGDDVDALREDILFDEVSFYYGTDKKTPVLEGFSVKIPLGKTTALIGPSGIGKSTVADLLLRLYDPQKGMVVVNGKDLREWNLRSWRQRIGFVSQDTFVFNMSIRDNIRLGKLDAADKEIINAAKKAYAHEFIESLPQGYDTVVGDRGLKLSGGQRQRVAIARAIIRDPDLFIFDEATSALDRESEDRIQRAIEDLGKEKTIVIIAHRLSTIEKADVVYNLQDVAKKKKG